jgi:hypothetical protein
MDISEKGVKCRYLMVIKQKNSFLFHVLTCQSHRYNHLNLQCIYRISYGNAIKANPRKKDSPLLKKRYHRWWKNSGAGHNRIYCVVRRSSHWHKKEMVAEITFWYPTNLDCYDLLQIVRHEAAQEMRVCWSLGVGLQEQAPKHLKLHW